MTLYQHVAAAASSRPLHCTVRHTVKLPSSPYSCQTAHCCPWPAHLLYNSSCSSCCPAWPALTAAPSAWKCCAVSSGGRCCLLLCVMCGGARPVTHGSSHQLPATWTQRQHQQQRETAMQVLVTYRLLVGCCGRCWFGGHAGWWGTPS
jgi:hypothetical protein